MFFRNKNKSEAIRVNAPLSGAVVPMTEVPDNVFATGIVGNGVAIVPAPGMTDVYAPADATVELMFDTGHAVSLTTTQGVEILIHAGIDTVQLKGSHFFIHCKNGDQVKAGQLLFSFDAGAIQAEGYPIITPVVLANLDAFGHWQAEAATSVSAGELLFTLTR